MPIAQLLANAIKRTSFLLILLASLALAIIPGNAWADSGSQLDNNLISSADAFEGPIKIPTFGDDATLYSKEGDELFLGINGSDAVLPILQPGSYELKIIKSSRSTRLERDIYDIEVPFSGAPLITKRFSSQPTLITTIFGLFGFASALLLSLRRKNIYINLLSIVFIVLAGPLRIIESSPNILGLSISIISFLVISILWRDVRTRRFTPLVSITIPPLTLPALVFVPVIAALINYNLLIKRRIIISIASLTTVMLFVVAITTQAPLSTESRVLAINTQLSDCSLVKTPKDLSGCVVDYFIARLKTGSSLNAVLQELASSQFDPIFTTKGQSNCHGIAHYLGQRLYNEGVLVGQLGDFASLCGLGLLHGLSERAGVSADSTQFAAAASSCLIPNSSHAKACSHGIGHGAYVRSGGDLTTAITLCEGLKGINLSECIGGAFMIYADSWTSFTRFNFWPGHIKPFPASDGPLDVCNNRQVYSYSDICVTSMLEVFRNYNLDNVNSEISEIAKAVSWCESHPEFLSSCSTGLGSAVNGYKPDLDPNLVSSVCSRTDLVRCISSFSKVYALMFSLRGETPTTDICDAISVAATICRDEILKIISEDPRL